MPDKDDPHIEKILKDLNLQHKTQDQDWGICKATKVSKSKKGDLTAPETIYILWQKI